MAFHYKAHLEEDSFRAFHCQIMHQQEDLISENPYPEDSDFAFNHIYNFSIH